MSCASVAAAGGLIALALHWQERTLREARSELNSGDPRRALALASYFLDTRPDHSAALALKARALIATGQAKPAIEIYEKVGAATVEDVHAWARAHLLLESWSRALALLSQVLRMEPDHADALHEITACRIRLGLLQEASESAGLLAQLPEQQAKGLVFLAAIASDLGNPDKAIQTYQQVVELSPDGKGLQIPPEELFTQYGMVLHNRGRNQEAVQCFQKGLASRPTAATYYYLGNAHFQAGNTDLAEQAWKKSLELDPAGIPVHEALADGALQKGDMETALKWLGPLERVAQTRLKTAYLFQRVCMKRKDKAGTERWSKKAEELRKQDQRRQLLDQMMTQAPHSFWANVVRAHRFAAQGNWQQAADMIQELAREAPKDPLVRDLAAAIRQRRPLPSLDRVPVKQF